MRRAIVVMIMVSVGCWTGLWLAQGSPAFAQAPHAAASVELRLSPKLRAALVAEMAALRDGAAELAVSLAAGEWDKVAATAGRMRDSYILKQQLTAEERKELHRALPADFLALDERFHRHADALARAATGRDHELSLFYFSRMMEGCVACHARYAAHTLKGFAPAAGRPHTH